MKNKETNLVPFRRVGKGIRTTFALPWTPLEQRERRGRNEERKWTRAVFLGAREGCCSGVGWDEF